MIRAFLLLTAFLILGASTGAYAQDAGTPQITRGQLEPITPTITPQDMISNTMANTLFKQCRSFYPRRFTPTALDSYCECSMVATQVNMTAKEYTELQNPLNRKITNPTYQKYITTVVAPCMITPTVDIEYMYCVLDRYADNRVKSFPQYCQCVAREMRDHVELNGDVDMMITMGSNPKINDPFEALWMNTKYMETSRQSRTACLGKYMKQPIKYSYN